jgi:hypothetical protein
MEKQAAIIVKEKSFSRKKIRRLKNLFEIIRMKVKGKEILVSGFRGKDKKIS